MQTCEILRYVGVELLGLGNVRPEGCCIQQLHSICALWGMARLVHAQHVAAQGTVLQPHNCASSHCTCRVKQACKEAVDPYAKHGPTCKSSITCIIP